MASTKEIRALITLAGKIDPSLQSAMLKASGQNMKLKEGLKQTQSIFKGTFFGNLAATAFVRLGGKMMGLGKEGLGLASDLKEVQNVVDTTFGANAKAIDDWSKQSLMSFGLSELQAKQYTGTMGAMLKSSGLTGQSMVQMSQNLTGLSGDLASFYNISSDEAFQKIRSGISGETEPLKQLGINMSVANLEAYALSKGIKTSYQNMDQASQTALRYSYLMSVTKDAQGDFAKTSDGAANQQRLFDTNLKQTAATLMSKVLPYYTKFLQKSNELMTNGSFDAFLQNAAIAFNLLGDGIEWAADNSNWLIPALIGVAGGLAAFQVISGISRLMKLWAIATEGQTIAQWALNVAMNANPIGLVAIGIGLLIAAGVALWKNWDVISAKAAELWGAFKKFIAPIGKLFGLGGETMSIQTSPMPEYASGGFANQPSIFGEAGPEVAIPLHRNSRSLSLLSQTARAIGAAPGGSGDVQLVYAPQIYGANRAEIEPLLQRHKEELMAMIEDYFEGKERVAFGY